MDSLQLTDARAASVDSNAPRVTLEDIQNNIRGWVTTTADHLFDEPDSAYDEHKILTICILTVKNGFTVIGKSAPASPERFDKKLGEELAYEDAVRQLWPLMGYALRDQLHKEAA